MKESPLFIKSYDLTKWLLEHTGKFPRNQRHVLAQRIEDASLSFQERLLWATKEPDCRVATLKEASYELERLKLSIRLAMDLKLFSLQQYEYVSRMVSEVGNLLGGWMKKV
jgi:hypothetical protein